MKLPIKMSIGLFVTSLLFCTVSSHNQIAKAQNCNYYAGKAVGGKALMWIYVLFLGQVIKVLILFTT